MRFWAGGDLKPERVGNGHRNTPATVKEEKRTMATKLYVGNLSFQTSEEDLQRHFEQAGTVTSCSIIMDKFTDRSRGFGFVEMGSQEEADKAIEMFNGKDMDGRALTVNEARPREDRPPRGGGFDGGGGGYGGGRDRRGGGRDRRY